jgi:hypothetical protein
MNETWWWLAMLALASIPAWMVCLMPLYMPH